LHPRPGGLRRLRFWHQGDDHDAEDAQQQAYREADAG
jgi:hypothetical protein